MQESRAKPSSSLFFFFRVERTPSSSLFLNPSRKYSEPPQVAPFFFQQRGSPRFLRTRTCHYPPKKRDLMHSIHGDGNRRYWSYSSHFTHFTGFFFRPKKQNLMQRFLGKGNTGNTMFWTYSGPLIYYLACSLQSSLVYKALSYKCISQLQCLRP